MSDAEDAARFRYIRDSAFLYEPDSRSMNRADLEYTFVVGTGTTSYPHSPKPPSFTECIDLAMAESKAKQAGG